MRNKRKLKHLRADRDYNSQQKLEKDTRQKRNRTRQRKASSLESNETN